MLKIAPSLLACDLSKLEAEVNSIPNADYLHFDVMDGHFVPNITFGIPVLESLRKVTDKLIDVHLMIDKPVNYIERFYNAGADVITFHAESCTEEEIIECAHIAKSCKKKIGIAIKPLTSVTLILPYLDLIDMALIMTVEPGFGGQNFIYDTVEKIRYLRSISNIDIEVDGGINFETAKICVDSGANVLVAGSYIFKSQKRKELISDLLSIQS